MISHTGILHRILFPTLLWRMSDSKIYLTFDDGPHSLATPAVLESLRRHKIQATFFLSGENIPGQEHIVEQIAADGHSLGIHAYHHSRLLALSKERTMNEIRETERLISGVIHQKIHLFRPPFGFFSWNTVHAARELGYRLVMWSCLPGDFRSWENEKVIGITMKDLSGGSIIVLHDNDRTQHKIADILDTLIPRIKMLGFSFGVIR